MHVNRPDGAVGYYEGDKDEEHLVSANRPDGQRRPKQRVPDTQKSPDGTMVYYKWGRRAVRVVRTVLPDGTV